MCASSSSSSTPAQELWAQPWHTLQITHPSVDCEYKYPQYMQGQSFSLSSEVSEFVIHFLRFLFLFLFSEFFFSVFLVSGFFLTIVLFTFCLLFISVMRSFLYGEAVSIAVLPRTRRSGFSHSSFQGRFRYVICS